MRLVAENLRKSYGGQEVVRGVSFSVEPGEILGLLGPNGAGKSSIVSMLYGSVIPDSGKANLVTEKTVLDSSTPQSRYSLGIVAQEDNLDPDFPVFENLLLFASYYRIGAAEAKKSR